MVEPTHLKNMRKSNWIISPGRDEQKHIFETTTQTIFTHSKFPRAPSRDVPVSLQAPLLRESLNNWINTEWVGTKWPVTPVFSAICNGYNSISNDRLGARPSCIADGSNIYLTKYHTKRRFPSCKCDVFHPSKPDH